MRHPARRAGGLLLAALLASCLGARAEESRAYHGLWGSLFKQQAGGSSATAAAGAAQTAGDGLRQALSDLQARLLHLVGRPTSSTGDDSAVITSHSAFEDLLSSHLNLTLSLLDHSAPSSSSDASSSNAGSSNTASGGRTAGGSSMGNGNSTSLLQKLHNHLSQDWAKLDPQHLATIAAVQAWALSTLLPASGSSSSNASSSSSSSSSIWRSLAAGMGSSSSSSSNAGFSSSSGVPEHQLAAKPVPDPAWNAFRGHICLRLQNFGNAEGYNAALLGTCPCSSGSSSCAAAVSGEALRWGKHASFLLDCAKGGSGSSAGGEEPLGSSFSGSSAFSNMLQAAASKAAASVTAAFDRTLVCRLALTTGDVMTSSTDSGGSVGTLLEHLYERPLLASSKLDALRVRICNMPPTTLQYPAALVHGTSISLSALKLNGRPLLPTALQASQAASAADGCLVQLYRLPSKATKGGFMLSGWVRLSEGASGGGTGSMLGSSSSFGSTPGLGSAHGFGMSSPAGGFGVGEMASVEVQLGEYSRFDAAASRLLNAATGAGGGAAQQAQQQAH